MKIIIHLISISLFILNFSFAGCGKCVSHTKNIETTSSVELISTLGEDGSISGMVQTSCGMCNFGMKNQKSCSLAIQVGEQSYPVVGTTISDHGDQHAIDGMCNAVRVAQVDGVVKDNVFVAESFQLQENKTN
ncbi:DUF6370 family protein [Candidatus Marinimicrobia bacterium]|nr:DUF6370 family protein [Candidatus Neomarinimicrobiota bacterium]MDC1038021.1 DUF6370 family protein [Candidatus Neomarinimicrobiota bacterium]